MLKSEIPHTMQMIIASCKSMSITGIKKDDATLMLGRCYTNLGDSATARTYFQNVIDEYPDSEYVEKAREWLSRI